jgi:hypothetical protein
MCRPGSRLGEISTKTVDVSQIHAVPAGTEPKTDQALNHATFVASHASDSHGYNVWPPVGDNPTSTTLMFSGTLMTWLSANHESTRRLDEHNNTRAG